MLRARPLAWFGLGVCLCFFLTTCLIISVTTQRYEPPKDAPVARLCTTKKINPWHFKEPLWEYCDYLPMKSNI